MLILPAKYVGELRFLPHNIASPTVAHAINLSSRVTNMDIILKNNLHFRTLQEKLKSNLAKLTRPMQEELAFGNAKELPACDGMSFGRFSLAWMLTVGDTRRLGRGSTIPYHPASTCSDQREDLPRRSSLSK